jgi:signal transduction histidine kinase
MKQDSIPNSSQELSNMFLRFVDSSEKLQSAYENLQSETDALRQRLDKKDQEIAQAAKMATLGQAAAALAHEIRNPLGAIKLFVSLLSDEVQNSPAGQSYLNHIQISISQLDATISNILHFSKDSPLSLSPLNIASLLQERIQAFNLSEPNIKIDLNLAASDIYVLAQEQSLRQIINNLFSNACQAMRHNGCISVDLEKSEQGSAILRIRDHGPGVDETIINQIFEPFVTSKNEGVGLGLSIVKRIVEQHHAHIQVKNNCGAVFEITFPACNASKIRLAA